MQKKESNKLDKKLTDKIIKLAYGDANIVDRIYVSYLASSYEKVNELLQEYKQTANVVHTVKQENISDQIIKSVRNRTTKETNNGSLLSGLYYIISLIFGKKAIPAITLVAISIAIVSFILFRNPTPTPKYSKAEIELAEKQFRESIAIVGKIFEKAEKDFGNEILNNQVNKNLSRGYFLVNNILIGG